MKDINYFLDIIENSDLKELRTYHKLIVCELMERDKIENI